jgi:formylmethanofuran dehydrogenase subunit E
MMRERVDDPRRPSPARLVCSGCGELFDRHTMTHHAGQVYCPACRRTRLANHPPTPEAS